MAMQRSPQTVMRPCLRFSGAFSMALLGFWLWGSSASAQSDGVPGDHPIAERFAEPISEATVVNLSGDAKEAEEEGAVDGVTSGLTIATRPPADPVADLAPPDAEATVTGGTGGTIKDERTSLILDSKPGAFEVSGHPLLEETVPSDVGGEDEDGALDASSGLVEQSATSQGVVGSESTVDGGMAVEEAAEITLVDLVAIPAFSAPGAPQGIDLVLQQDAPSLRRLPSMPEWGQTVLDGMTDGHSSHAGVRHGQRWAPWPGIGHSINVMIGDSSSTGGRPPANGTLFASAAPSSSGAVPGPGGHAPARALSATGLAVATGVVARLPRGRLRSKTIQGAVAGAGPPSVAGLRPVRPASLVGGTLAAQASELHPAPTLPFLASIRRPPRASRLRDSFPRPDSRSRAPQPRLLTKLAASLVSSGEQRSRWQRLHCALSPPPSGDPPVMRRTNPQGRYSSLGP